MVKYKVKDLSLSNKGILLKEWASKRMPVLSQIRQRFKAEKPLKELNIGACLHVTKETAVLAETLKAGGSNVTLCGSNPLSTQDEVAASLVKSGVNVYAWRGQTSEEYYWCMNKTIENPHYFLIKD